MINVGQQKNLCSKFYLHDITIKNKNTVHMTMHYEYEESNWRATNMYDEVKENPSDSRWLRRDNVGVVNFQNHNADPSARFTPSHSNTSTSFSQRVCFYAVLCLGGRGRAALCLSCPLATFCLSRSQPLSAAFPRLLRVLGATCLPKKER